MSIGDKIAVAAIIIPAIILAIQLIVVLLDYFRVTKSINDYTNEFRTMIATEKTKSVKQFKQYQILYVVGMLIAGTLLILVQIAKRRGSKA